jgi:putative DNA primase/helicase
VTRLAFRRASSQQRSEQAQPSLKAYRVEFLGPLTEYAGTKNGKGDIKKLPSALINLKSISVNPQRKNRCSYQRLCIQPSFRMDTSKFMLPQVAEAPTVIDVLASSIKSEPKNYSAFEEWTQGSGVSEVITKLNLKSLTDRKVIASKLRWKKYFDEHPLGWWVSGLDLKTMKPHLFGQFKPETAIQLSPEDERPAKYLTRKGGYDAIALQHPEEDYWQRVIDDPSIPIALDEGTKKAGMLMTLGFVALALCGVWMGLKKGGKELVNNLALLAVQGRPITIVFDADLAFKAGVQQALMALATVLKKKGCIVSVAIIPLELESKGIDDVRVKHGEEMVKKIMADAIPYSQWLKSLEAQVSNSEAEARDTRGEKKSNKPPTPRETALPLAEEYRSRWQYDNKQKAWRVWNDKCWQKTEIGVFTSLLQTVLDAKNVPYNGIEYINNVLALLECKLRQPNWQTWDKSRYITFNNCVFDGATGKTLPHSPGTGFTSHLPYDYKPLEGDLTQPLEALQVNCPNVHKFFQTAMKGDVKKMFKLLAIINGCLRFGFFGWQMFVHLIGEPGSGKGTFARLMEKLVGKDNSQPCSLDQLKDGSTLASIMDKQLVVFGDERKPVGVDSILRLTGGDSINYREIYKPTANAHFYGLLLICSNDPIFMGNTRGLERRLCLVNFDNPIPGALRDSKIEDSFDSEIASLIAIALSLPNNEVKRAIQGKGDAEIADFKAAEWDMKVRMDSVAAFFEMELVLEEKASDTVGKLYERYKDFCDEIKKPAMSLTSFSPTLERICAELQQPVRRDPSGRHVTFYGLRRRREEDEHPTYSQKLAALAGLDTAISSTSAPLDAGLAPIPCKDLQDLQDLTSNILPELENSQQKLDATPKTAEIEEVTPSTAATPAEPLPSKALSPANTPANPPVSPAATPATKRHHKEFKVGDRVRIVERGLHHGKDGKVVAVSFGSVENDYRIALDKESHMSREVTVTVPHSQKFPILMNL